MLKGFKSTGFIVGVAAVIVATVIICACAASCSGGNLTFKTCYYFVCYRITDNAISASSLSGTVSSYGGAGYILNYDDDYYVTVSCYYKRNDAEAVCASLKRRELECSVLEVKTEKYKLKSYSAKKNAELYLGNLNTLYSLSSLAYECANGLDTGAYTQEKAKDVVSSIKSGLISLLHANAGNCFMHGINAIIAECEDKERGFLYSKDMRYLQIAVIDLIVNIELY